jgi:hypothetical protein
MAVVTIKNPSVSDNIKTFLSAEYSSGTTLTVDSSLSFVSGSYIVVGEPGLENSEMTNLTATPPTNSSLTITSLKFSHPRGTPVYYISWDKYNLEYRTSTTGDWTAYGLTDLKYDSIYTEYRDSSATSTYQWRYRYYSSENSAYSDYSDIISATGWARNTVGYLVRDVRKIINDPNSETVTDAEIIRYFNTAQDKIYSLYDRWWFLFKIGTAIPTVADTRSYSLPSDFGRMHSVLFNYVNDTTDISYNLKYIPMVEYEYLARDNNDTSNDEVKYWTIYPGDSDNATGYIYLWPIPETAALDITPKYYKTMTALDGYGDTTEVPIPSMLADYALGEIFKIRRQEDKADYYDKLFKQQIELLKLMQRKQVGQPRYLWKYQGNADERYFGNRTLSPDDQRENYF